jgi:hypothetical protein
VLREGSRQQCWKRRLASPAHAAFESVIDRLPGDCFPGCDDLNALLTNQAGGAGRPLRFVPPRAGEDESYEARIFEAGEVSTRPDNWHDLFNALAWLAFPQAKRALNRAHHEHAQEEAGRRGGARDALTLFDESGVMVACADPELAELLRGFRWKTLFWERRDDVVKRMRFFVFGHGLLEQALRPYPGMTGKALIHVVASTFFGQPVAEQLAALDGHAAAWAGSTPAPATQSLSPLPLLGIPGWDTANDAAAYYDNTEVFRPGRRPARRMTR